MRKFVAILLSLATTGGCARTVPNEPVVVDDVIKNIHIWDGKFVTVVGWLGTCEGYDCGIYSTLAGAKMAATNSGSKAEWNAAMDRRVSLAFDTKFDRAAKPLQFKLVSIRAKISDECRGFLTGCTDRAPDLYPLSIQSYPPTKVN